VVEQPAATAPDAGQEGNPQTEPDTRTGANNALAHAVAHRTTEQLPAAEESPIPTPDRHVQAAANKSDGDISPTEPSPASELAGEGKNNQQKQVTDPQLADLLIGGAQAIGQEALDKVLAANERFRKPNAVTLNTDGTHTPEPEYANKTLLGELPAYAAAATEVALDPAQASELLTHAMDSQKYPDDPYVSSNVVAIGLTRALTAAAEGGDTIGPEQFDSLKQLVSKASDWNALSGSLDSYAAARQAGLSHADSVQVIDGYLDTVTSREAQTSMDRFRDTLRAFNGAAASPSDIVDIVRSLERVPEAERQHMYGYFRRAVTFRGPTAPQGPGQVTNHIAERLRAGVSNRQIMSELRNPLALGSAENSQSAAFTVQERINRFFPDKPGALEHRALPYRTPRSLRDGIADLQKLALADGRRRGEVVAEGSWIYDPHRSTWYSMGGETSLIPDISNKLVVGMRHTAIERDISDLSTDPMSFHIHPADFGSHSDKYSFAFPTAADYHATAKTIENASQPIALRSFISHGMGLTEFTYPTSDPAAIRQVAETFEDLRAQFTRRFDSERHLVETGRAIGNQAMLRAWLRDVNRRLPPGFKIQVYQ
jgi:hypothetical protein